jgi:Fe-S cluster biogenesis protein NfuA
MIAAVLLAVALAAPATSQPKHQKYEEDKESADVDVDIDIPAFQVDIPELNLPAIKIPAIRVQAHDLDQMSREMTKMTRDMNEMSFLVATSKHKKDKDKDEDRDEDDDCDEDCGPEAPMPPMPAIPPIPPVPPMPPNSSFEREDRNGFHIYRPQPAQPGVRIRVERHDDNDDDSDEGSSSSRAQGKGSATLAVKGPVTFRISAQGGSIEVVSTDKQQVSVHLEGHSDADVSLYSYGDRVEPHFRNRRSLRSGKLKVELPKGSRLEVESMSGDVSAQRLGEAKIRTLSGDIKLSQMGKLDVQSISGDVVVDEASGPVRLHTVSGKATLSMRNQAPQVEFQSASGSLDFKGACGKDCHMSAATVSGDLKMALAAQSSFELSYSSHSGELRDGLDLSVHRSNHPRHGSSRGSFEGTYGKGEGVIEADAFSGNLTLSKQ